MQLHFRGGGAVELRCYFELPAWFNLALDPHLGSAVVLPIGKQTDAVTGREYVVQMLSLLD